METPPRDPQNCKSQSEQHLLETLTKILTSENFSFESLNPYIPHLSTNLALLISLLNSKTLTQNPNTLLQFYMYLPPSITYNSPLPLVSLLPSILRYRHFHTAKSLLSSFISVDKSSSLHHLLLHPQKINNPVTCLHISKPLLDVSIGAYVACGRPHQAAQIFNRMKRLGMQPNLLTCNTLLNALVRYPSSHSIRLSKAVFSDFIKFGVKINTNSFNILIHGSCMENRFGEAIRVLGKMGDYGCPPDNITYNTILDGLCKKGRLNEARELLLDMKNKGLFPNRTTFNILVVGCCKLGWLKEAANVIELMSQNNVVPDVWTYNVMIGGFCKQGRIDEALRLREEIESLKLSPDVVTYNTLINGCFEHGSSEEGFKLIDEMEGRGMKLNSVTYNVMVKWFVKKGKMDEVDKTVRKMEESGGLTDAGRMKDAEEFISKIAEKGKSEYQFLELGKRQDARSGEISQEPHPDAIAYSNKINELCSQGRYKDAMKIFHESTQKNIVLLKSTYLNLMDGLIKRRKSTSKAHRLT
ncbi:hypothetical protein OIU76_012467 [Salix suchowensis]|nr:hypothetical protein OIU76_012467 [Salix suchowensis]